MNRTLTAAVALAAGLGMAGLAQAQMNPANSGVPGSAPYQQGTTTQNPQSGMPGTQQGETQQPSTSMQGAQHVSASQGDIQQAQQELKSAGLYNGRVDGIDGRQTKMAVSKFQQQNGLPRTSMLDQQTMSKLGQGNGSGQSPQPQQPNPAPTTR
jgi:peptidoglycan hydrolase-like protein with peptidoglycan-binding domain